ncbi:MAG: sugar transferase [Pseudomonadota bacterium]
MLVALLIRLDSPGPILYVSPRVGKGGRNFPFYKFRSMVQDANAQKAELLAQNEADGRLFKMREDPRITRFGRFIRKFSVDEFPQLLNVLRGDMNLVGPRPLPAEDLLDLERDPEALYWFELRSKVKPGMTGLWQVSGRSGLTFADMVALDIQYVQNWSFWTDLVILLKTLPAVFRGSGAH